MKNRKWFLTINNFDDKEWWNACDEVHKCKYGICCKEVGELGTPHLHIWLHYENARTGESVQKKFPRCWKQVGKGNDNDQVYLKKQNEFVEHGIPEKQGRRKDIDTVKEIIAGGGGMEEVVTSVNSYQAMRCAELILKYTEKPRPINPIKVFWFYGGAGTGKTRYVFDNEDHPFTPITIKWWEGYDADAVVLIDDWRPEWCGYKDLLRLTDIYPFRVESKGGSRQVQYKKIYITSDLSPREYFGRRSDKDLLQLERRITLLKCFDTDTEVEG